MTRVLDELELTPLVTSITGLSAVGAAAIQAETGDPRRFANTRVGQTRRPAPREKLSGTFTGRTKLTGQRGVGDRLDRGGSSLGATETATVAGLIDDVEVDG